jgi:hypothetical protein
MIPYRRTDEVVYVVERQPPYTVVNVVADELPVSPVLIGMPGALIMHALEPEQITLLDTFSRALTTVRVGAPVVIRYRPARYYNMVRVAEVVDRGPEHRELYVFCHREAASPYDPARDVRTRR